MGLYHSLYVGLYIQIKEINVSWHKPEFAWLCSKCENAIDTDFCPTCGTQAVSREQEVKIVINTAYDLMRYIEGEFDTDYSDKYVVMEHLSNVIFPNDNRFGKNYDNNDENLAIKMQHYTELNFRTAHEDFLAILDTLMISYSIDHGVISMLN